MSFFGLFSSLRRSLQSCSTSNFEMDKIAWRKLDFLLKESSSYIRTFNSTEYLENLLCPFRKSPKIQSLWETVSRGCNEKFVLFGGILTQQCHFYAAQRLVRMTRVGSLYHRLYTERTMRHMVTRLVKRIRSKQGRSFGMILGASFFSWETEKITEKDLKRCVDEFDELSVGKRQHSQSRAGNVTYPIGENGCGVEQASEDSWSVYRLQSQGWEPVIQRDCLHVWRKSVPGSYLYEYKVFGTFYDIPAKAFFSVQMDTEYRKRWDKLVISLDIIDKDDQGCEVIHWVMHYPYPMYSRDYVYIRRALVDKSQGVMVLMSRATDHPGCPVDKKFVRVKKYFSQMVIRPHKDADEIGFDYLLSYFDDPEAAFPAPAYNWMASSGVPDFVEKLHSAARVLYLGSASPTSQCSQPVHHLHSGPSLQKAYA